MPNTGRAREENLLRIMETMRRPNGAFVAAPSAGYSSCWLRDQLYVAFSYYYLGQHDKLRQGLWVVFDILEKHRWKIEQAICNPPQSTDDYLHAKYHPDTLNEVTPAWGHHQIDAIGLLLHIVADLDFKNIHVIRNQNDSDLIQLLVFYLLSLRYWEVPDNGMWEEEEDLHASSIGAAVAGLSYINRRELAFVPQSLIMAGRNTLYTVLPNESPTRDIDMAQLSLIWPYSILSRETDDVILHLVREKLVQQHGVNRYWGDRYHESKATGISGQWPMGFFWLSIIASQRNDLESAVYWFECGMEQITPEGFIPEIYTDDTPNENTPLAWAHAMALIAHAKIRQKQNKA